MQCLWQNQDDVNAVILTSPAERRALHGIFAQVSQEQGWQAGDQLAAYERDAVHFALKVGAALAGGLQLVRGSEASGLPCLRVWPELELQERHDVAEIALLALLKPYRGSAYFWLLCVEMWRYCRRTDVCEIWMEATPANLRIYRRLGWPLHVAGPLRPHWGEDCYPCYLRVQEVKDVIVQKAQKSPMYRTILAYACRDEFLGQEAIPCGSGTA